VDQDDCTVLQTPIAQASSQLTHTFSASSIIGLSQSRLYSAHCYVCQRMSTAVARRVDLVICSAQCVASRVAGRTYGHPIKLHSSLHISCMGAVGRISIDLWLPPLHCCSIRSDTERRILLYNAYFVLGLIIGEVHLPRGSNNYGSMPQKSCMNGALACFQSCTIIFSQWLPLSQPAIIIAVWGHGMQFLMMMIMNIVVYANKRDGE